MADIANASQEQTAGIGQVAQALTDMEKMTQQNAAMVEQASAAGEQLEQQAHHLVEVVSVFKIGEAELVQAPRAAEPRRLRAMDPAITGTGA
jgi:acetolactate synthase small subunit